MRLRSSLALLCLLAGCVHHPPVATPIPVAGTPAGVPTDTVVVLLPGIKDRARVFEQRGFLAAFRRHGVPVDLLAVDAHVSYYEQGLLLRRLHEDVIAPARRRYKRVILLGVSLGGYGAVRYARTYPGEVDALVLFSPFLGLGPVMRGLADAGDEDFQDSWAWLKSEARPRTLLLFGNTDAFLVSDHALRELLPKDDVLTLRGGHFWPTWRSLLERALTDGAFASLLRRTKADLADQR